MPAAKNFFALTIYVSPEGNDYFRGIKPELDKENNGPKATLLGAVNEIALLAKAGTIKGPVNVLLRGGRYFLKKTVIFLPAHSYPIIFESYPGEEAIIDGGSRISSWKPANLNGRKIWQADVKELLEQRGRFRQLFVNNLRATPSRYPKKGFVRMEEVKIPDITDLLGGQDRFKASPDGFSATWRNPQSLDIMILNYWISTRLPVKSFNADTREVVLSMTSTFMMRDESGDGSFAKYFVENVVEELSEPGEWALDTAAGILYYVPRPGETIKQAEAFVSHVKQLLVFEGAPDSHEYIEHLSFRNLAFEHSDWGEPVNSIQSDVLVPGTISATGTRFVNFEHCRFEHLGCYAIKFGDGCFSNSVVGCTIRDIGAGGIIANGSDATGSLARRNGDNSYTDNVITQCGRVFMCACGIITQHSYGNLIAHNTISDLYYTGISCGWVWGYADSVSKENRIEYNHIFNLGQGVLSDMGGVYLLGIQPGTRVYNNLIHDIERAKYGGWGIYPDEGSSHVVIENNVVYNTSSSSFHQHYGRENLVINNIFAFGIDCGARLTIGRSRLRSGYSHPGSNFDISLRFYRNIFLSKEEPALMFYDLKSRDCDSDLNIVWSLKGADAVKVKDDKPKPAELISWSQWQSLGFDRFSLVADPGFKNIGKFDFTLKTDSPAFKLGFKSIDLSKVGPRTLIAQKYYVKKEIKRHKGQEQE